MSGKCISIVINVLLIAPLYAIPNGLVAHWPFEEGSGTTAVDHSGNGNDGTVSDSAEWVAGKIDGALRFNGIDSFVRCPYIPFDNRSFTVALWINMDELSGNRVFFSQDGANNQGGRLHLRVRGGGEIRMGYYANDLNSGPIVVPGEWLHLTCVHDVDNTTRRIHANGMEIATDSGGPYVGITGDTIIGCQYGRAQYFPGIIDDVQVYHNALTENEILSIMDGLGDPHIASNPIPEDEATDVIREPLLSWTAGEAKAKRHVYLGTSFSDVNDATVANPLGVLIRQDLTDTTVNVGVLAFDQTYYWRVDEVNAPPDSTVFPGAVWSFTTEPVGYPIDGADITATASSSGEADFGPEKTIDGSGLDADGLHSTEATDMWLSGSEPQGAWIQYELDKVYKLHQMWVWNANQDFESLFGFGLKDVTVEYSTNGADWTALAGVPEFAQASGTADYAHNTTVDFAGAVAKYVKLTATSNWGGVLPQYGLSEVRFFSIPVSARGPSPDSGAADVDVDATLAWRAGREAGTHNVYLGTDEQAVIDGTASAVTLADASYSSELNLGGTYYWRVDEVNDIESPSAWQGDVWSFTTQEYLVVDGFEDYNDYPPDEIYTTWLDGYENPANGSQVGYLTPPSVETAIVHGDGQSMPLLYGNTGGATFSEAERTFAAPQDWTKYGVKTLGLWFHGTSGNTGQLYVKINGVKVLYDGDAGNLAVAAWQPWNIDLTALGVNLQSVTTLAIGIDGSGAAGTLYFDDIRLYAYERKLTTPSDPGSAGLVAHYKLDQNASDSSGNGHNGVVEGAPTWASPGADGTGGCMKFGGDADRITVEPFELTGSGITLSAWINPNTFQNDARMISKSVGGSTQFHTFAMVLSGSNEDALQFRLNTDQGSTTSHTSGGTVAASEWSHIAVTWDASDPVMREYINGLQVGSRAKAGSAVATDPAAKIGIGNQSISALTQGPGNEIRPFDGLIDEVRVYERGLSVPELVWLAGRTQPFDEPF